MFKISREIVNDIKIYFYSHPFIFMYFIILVFTYKQYNYLKNLQGQTKGSRQVNMGFIFNRYAQT